MTHILHAPWGASEQTAILRTTGLGASMISGPSGGRACASEYAES